MTTAHTFKIAPPKPDVPLSKLAKNMKVHIGPLKQYLRTIAQWPDVQSDDMVPCIMADSLRAVYKPDIELVEIP